LRRRCDTAPAAEVGHHFIDHATVATCWRRRRPATPHARSAPIISTLTAYVGRLAVIQLLARLAPALSLREDLLKSLDDASLRGLGGAGFSHGTQVALGAGRAGSAADGRQWRRGRARHLQGPLLPRNRSASLSRGQCSSAPHVVEAPRSISISATNIRPRANILANAIAQAAAWRTLGCICAAAPAPTSAGEEIFAPGEPGKVSAACPGTSRLSVPGRACSACQSLISQQRRGR